MNHTEATTLVTVLNRAGLVPALEGQAAVWQMALDDVPFPVAQTVARRMIATRTSDQRWVTPGDIRAAVATERKRLIGRMTSPQPPQQLADDPRAEHAWTRAYVTAIGDGHEPADAEQLACDHVGIPVPAPTITAPRPALPQLHPGACACGCLTQHVRPEEGAADRPVHRTEGAAA